MFSTKTLLVLAAAFAPAQALPVSWTCYNNLGCTDVLEDTDPNAIAAGECTGGSGAVCDSAPTYYKCFQQGALGARITGDTNPNSCFMNKYDCWTDCECSKEDYNNNNNYYGQKWYNPSISTGAAMAQVVDGEWKTGYEMCWDKTHSNGDTISASIWGHSYYNAYKREDPRAYVDDPSHTSSLGYVQPYYCEVDPLAFFGCGITPIVGGDPHFETLAHKRFDFHGECDLIFIEAPSLDLTIHIRTKIQFSYSYVEAAVLSINGETIEVGDYGSIIVNGIYNADDRELPETVGGYPLELEVSNKKTHAYRILLGDGKFVQLKSFKYMVGVSVDLPREHMQDSYGLLGDIKHGQMLGRDHVTEINDPVAYGKDWVVTAEDRALFEAPAEHPYMCVMPEPQAESRRLGTAIARETAEAACANWHMNKEACIADVMATGDIEMASNVY